MPANKAGINRIKILFVAATPLDTPRISVGREAKVIKSCIERCRYRDNISIQFCPAATVDNLRQALLEEDFDIAHVAGHGGDGDIILEQDDGIAYITPSQALAELFQTYSPPLQCVILNACGSIVQGQLTSLGVPYTIAMEGPIEDDAAIEFSRGFYDAVGAGRNIEFGYEEGCRTVKLKLPTALFEAQILKGGDCKLAIINLSAQDINKRIKAAKWLGQTRQISAIPKLSERLRAELKDQEVFYWITNALGEIGGKDARQALLEFQQRFADQTDKFHRRSINEALALTAQSNSS